MIFNENTSLERNSNDFSDIEIKIKEELRKD